MLGALPVGDRDDLLADLTTVVAGSGLRRIVDRKTGDVSDARLNDLSVHDVADLTERRDYVLVPRSLTQ